MPKDTEYRSRSHKRSRSHQKQRAAYDSESTTDSNDTVSDETSSSVSSETNIFSPEMYQELLLIYRQLYENKYSKQVQNSQTLKQKTAQFR